MDTPISFASAALRNPAGLAWGGLKLKNPVVHDQRANRQPDAAAASASASTAAAAADEGGTPYTPGPRRGDGPPAPPPEGSGRALGPFNSAIASYQAVSQSLSYQRDDSFDLSVRTAEGDTATISISRAHSQSSSLAVGRYSSATGQGSALAFNSSSADSLSLEISVAGNLNDAETASINALLQKAQGVADDFFAGNQAQAAKGAAGLDISGDNNNTLGAFSFELQSRESLRAVATYESVAAATAPTAGAAQTLPPTETRESRESRALGADAGAANISAAPPPRDADFLRQLLSMFEDFARSAKELAGPARSEGTKPLVTAPVNPHAVRPDPAQVLLPDPAI